MTSALVKVLLQEDEYVETLWATPVSPDRYRLENSPFWAYGVSYRDVVDSHPDPDGMLRMTRVSEKAGHRTIRVIFEPDAAVSAKSKQVLDTLNTLGATYEGMNERYIAIDIPPAGDLLAVGRYLTEQQVQWEHADPRYSDLYPE